MGALAVAAAVISGRGELAAVAAAPLVLLALHPRAALPQPRPRRRTPHPSRCLEDDELSLRLVVVMPGAERVEAALFLPDAVDLRLATEPHDEGAGWGAARGP